MEEKETLGQVYFNGVCWKVRKALRNKAMTGEEKSSDENKGIVEQII